MRKINGKKKDGKNKDGKKSLQVIAAKQKINMKDLEGLQITRG